MVNSPTVGGGHIAIAHAQQCLGFVALNSVSARCELLGPSSRRAIFLSRCRDLRHCVIRPGHVRGRVDRCRRGTEDGEPVS